MPVQVPFQDTVDKYLPLYKPHAILEPGNPRNYNLVTLANPRVNAQGILCHGYMEIRYLLQEALQNSRETIAAVGQEFGELFGRNYAKLLWEHRMQDAEIAMVATGSLAMEAVVAADALREQGTKAGVLGLRVFRPFPGSDLVQALRRCRLIVVFDKNVSYGNEGATCNEIKAALYGSGTSAAVRNFIVGLGGRDVKARDLADAVKRALSSLDKGTLSDECAQWICEI
jgi:pyruvate ferredoxin oxidoreductase alpha subunit